MFQKLIKKATKDYKDVPLFFVNFDLIKYREKGAKGSCYAQLHPALKDDPYIKEQLNGVIDHIRENYDMEKLTK